MSSAESSRLAFVDTLRLIAAGLVVFQHLAERHQSPSIHMLVQLAPGVMGVVLFFLISGYVIPFSVRNGIDLRAFFIRRVFRIYPLFLVALAIVAIGGWTGILVQWSDVRDIGVIDWVANLLLVQDFVGSPAILGVSWTLIIELIWYAVFAAALIMFGDRAAIWLGIFVPVSLVALASISLVIDTRIPLGRPAMIYAAVLGYQLYQYHAGNLSRRQLYAALGGFFAVSWFCNIVSFGIFTHPHITLWQALGPWTVAPLLFFSILLPASVRTAPVLNRGLLPMAGAVSYSIYLLHPIANAAAEQYFSGFAIVPAALALTLLLAVLGYRYVELPGIALGRSLAARRPRLTTESIRL